MKCICRTVYGDIYRIAHFENKIKCRNKIIIGDFVNELLQNCDGKNFLNIFKKRLAKSK